MNDGNLQWEKLLAVLLVLFWCLAVVWIVRSQRPHYNGPRRSHATLDIVIRDATRTYDLASYEGERCEAATEVAPLWKEYGDYAKFAQWSAVAKKHCDRWRELERALR